MSTKTKAKSNGATAVSAPTAGADFFVEATEPYRVHVTIKGAAPILFHAWNCESVAEKAAAAKGSKAKKTDDIESYYYRDSEGFVAIPGMNFVSALVIAGRFKQDPRYKRANATKLVRAGVTPIELMPRVRSAKGKAVKEADFLWKGRMVVQKAAITRVMPAMLEGWECDFSLQVLLPEYIAPEFLYDLIRSAGQFCGLCDLRPTYGRFNITKFEVQK